MCAGEQSLFGRELLRGEFVGELGLLGIGTKHFSQDENKARRDKIPKQSMSEKIKMVGKKSSPQ